MKGFYEALKDFLHDAMDYIMMLAIVVAVIVLIGWRLDILFAKDIVEQPSKEDIVHNIDSKPVSKPKDEDSIDPDEGESPEEDANTKEPSSEEPSSDVKPDEGSKPSGETVQVHIPPGSMSASVGKILEEKGLVSSSKDFVQKSQELKLDTKIQAGNFKINTNSTIEEILKVITK